MNRQNVTGVTIDDRTTWDIDDAIWVEQSDAGFSVTVSIADVAKAVAVGSELDVSAKERVGTQYFRTGNSPMLPRPLAERALSLWPDRPKRTMTVQVKLDANLEVKEVQLFRSRLKSIAKLTYEQIPGILADATNKHHAMLTVAQKLAHGLLTKRRANGAMVLYDLNNGWVTTEEGFVRQLLKREDTIGYIIIQELMILANASVAQYAHDHAIPILFRNHRARSAGPDRAELLRQIDEAIHTPLADLTFIRQKTHMLLERAVYESTPHGHYGLNLPWYTHFTSPIRRYADLVVHQQLRAHLKGEPLPYTEEKLQETGEYIVRRVEEIQTLRSEHAKAKAERRANRAIELRRLDGLLPKEFERATKVQVRSGEDADPNFVEAFEKKLSEDAVPIICMALVIFQGKDLEGWVQIKHAIIDSLGAHPERAISLVGIANQGLGIPSLDYDVAQSGPPHAPVFKVRAKFMYDEPVEGPEYEAGNSKVAKQCAAVALLAQMSGAPVPTFREPPPAPAPQAPAPPPTQSFDFSKQPVSALMEWCQARKQPSPEFSYTQSGPPHMPTITCTVKVAGHTKTATATSKQDAKALAAAAIIGTLSKTQPSP